MLSIEASSLDCAELYYSILLLSIKINKAVVGTFSKPQFGDEFGSGNGIPSCLNNKVANAYGPALQLTHDA